MATQFEFVTIHRPDDIKSRKIQNKIKIHAGRSNPRRKLKQRTGAASQDDDKLEYADVDAVPTIYLASPPEAKDMQLAELQTVMQSQLLLQNPKTAFGIKPFQNYPFKLNAEARQTIDFVIYDATKNFRPIFALWAAVALDDPITFNLFLASATILFERATGKLKSDEVETVKAIKYYSTALHEVKTRLRDPKQSVSEAVIGSVLGFACQDSRLDRLDRWFIHMQGLKQIIELRGGMKTLSDLHHVRLAMFWIDMNGALGMDVPPHFEIPKDIVDIPSSTSASLILESVLNKLMSVSEKFVDICDVYRALARMSAFINDFGTSKGFFQHDQIYVDNFATVVFQVLSLPRQALSSEDLEDELSTLRETIRLAFLVYLSLVKRRFEIVPDSVSQHRERLQEVLSVHPLRRRKFAALRFWLLTVLAVATDETNREGPIDEIVETMQTIGLRHWSDVERIVKGIAWVNDLNGSSGLELLGIQIQQKQDLSNNNVSARRTVENRFRNYALKDEKIQRMA